MGEARSPKLIVWDIIIWWAHGRSQVSKTYRLGQHPLVGTWEEPGLDPVNNLWSGTTSSAWGTNAGSGAQSPLSENDENKEWCILGTEWNTNEEDAF
jgi:hypothetical protein